ncbi:hypothetical protein Droror1_Dr00023514 [Drosera rotundifolia]
MAVEKILGNWGFSDFTVMRILMRRIWVWSLLMDLQRKACGEREGEIDEILSYLRQKGKGERSNLSPCLMEIGRLTVDVPFDEITGGVGVDIAVEALGKPLTFLQCTQSVRDGGKAVMIGLAGSSARGEVNINHLGRLLFQALGLAKDSSTNMKVSPPCINALPLEKIEETVANEIPQLSENTNLGGRSFNEEKQLILDLRVSSEAG